MVTIANTQGQFVITNITPGRYLLQADRQGYLRHSYGALAAGAERKGLDFRMPRHGIITGRVLDPDGEPLEKHSVVAMRLMRTRGRTQYGQVVRAGTNDLGEFRVSDLPPGSYILPVTPPQYMDGATAVEDQAGESLVTTYFPGTTQQTEARPISITSGQLLSGFEFRLQRSRVYPVSGKVLVPAGNPRSYMLQLEPSGTSMPMGASAPPRIRDDGSFELNGLVPGSYLLLALTMGGPTRVVARVPIEVSREAIRGVEVLVREDLSVSGRIRLDGDLERYVREYGEKPLPARARLYLDPLDGPAFGSVSASPDSDWKFKLEGLGQDRLRLSFRPYPPGTYPKAILLNGTDVTATGIDLTTSSVENVEVVLGIGTGTARGRVLDDQKKPMPGEQVILVRDPYVETDPLGYRAVAANEKGEVEARNLPPGDYIAMAFDVKDPMQITSADVLKEYYSGGTRIKVRAWENTNFEVQWNYSARSN